MIQGNKCRSHLMNKKSDQIKVINISCLSIFTEILGMKIPGISGVSNYFIDFPPGWRLIKLISINDRNTPEWADRFSRNTQLIIHHIKTRNECKK